MTIIFVLSGENVENYKSVVYHVLSQVRKSFDVTAAITVNTMRDSPYQMQLSYLMDAFVNLGKNIENDEGFSRFCLT